MARSRHAYRGDLAYIHDVGYGYFATGAAPWLLALFQRNQIERGLVVDLGCGSGIWAQALGAAGYDVLGFDISPAMIALARKRAPKAEFRCESFLDVRLPPCAAVTAMGEILNYQFDERNNFQHLARLFRRIHDALPPGGLFVFDGAEPGRVPGGYRERNAAGADWACLSNSTEDQKQRTLTRDITTFRKVEKLYRRNHEVHRLRLFDREQVADELRKIGFRVRVIRGYGELRFPVGYVGFVARKA